MYGTMVYSKVIKRIYLIKVKWIKKLGQNKKLGIIKVQSKKKIF